MFEGEDIDFFISCSAKIISECKYSLYLTTEILRLNKTHIITRYELCSYYGSLGGMGNIL